MTEKSEMVALADWLDAGASLATNHRSKQQGEAAAKYLREFAARTAADWANQTEENRIDRLRLAAFKSNDARDRQAYFDAASKWFQDRHYRRMEAERAALPAPGGIAPVPQLEPWRDELSEIIGHLGAATVQSTASDDQIIMDHVKAAHEIAKIVRRKA